MTTIDYYISLNSPWTFLGSERFIAMTAKAGATVRTKPAKFGAGESAWSLNRRCEFNWR